MSKENVIAFFKSLRQDYYLQQKFNVRNLAELLFHAENLGYKFNFEHLSEVVAQMELKIITEKLQEKFGPYSNLWPKMWGKYRLEYVLEHLFNELTEKELEELLAEDPL